MATISISKEILREDIVVISRKEYERLLSGVTGSPLTLDESLELAQKEARDGKAIGPFRSARALMKSLHSR